MEFDIGDAVRIVDERPWTCKAGWANRMDSYLGMEAVITEICDKGMFRLDVDNGAWVWSDDIITEIEEITEFDTKGFSELLRF